MKKIIFQTILSIMFLSVVNPRISFADDCEINNFTHENGDGCNIQITQTTYGTYQGYDINFSVTLVDSGTPSNQAGLWIALDHSIFDVEPGVSLHDGESTVFNISVPMGTPVGTYTAYLRAVSHYQVYGEDYGPGTFCRLSAFTCQQEITINVLENDIELGTDNDGDGVTETMGDCNDTDSTIYPDAYENCGNGIDNNCDGYVDEPGENYTWYDDLDNDGYGDPEDQISQSNCLQFIGTVSNADDCDDNSALAHPGAPEDTQDLCEDTRDNDCDGIFDYDDSDCAPFIGSNEYYDYDGDTYNSHGGDCNDLDASIYPEAEEDCSDGIDNNCNGNVDVDDEECRFSQSQNAEEICNNTENNIFGAAGIIDTACPTSAELLADLIDNQNSASGSGGGCTLQSAKINNPLNFLFLFCFLFPLLFVRFFIKRDSVYLPPIISLFIFSFLLASCGGGGSGDSGIQSFTYDANLEDSLTPSGIPSVSTIDSESVIMECASAMTSISGLLLVECNADANDIYAICNNGHLVVASTVDGSAVEYDCSSIKVFCNENTVQVDSTYSGTCLYVGADISNYISVDLEHAGRIDDETSNDDNPTDAHVINGTIAISDPSDFENLFYYYDTYAISGSQGQKLIVELTEAASSIAYIALYDDSFNSSNVAYEIPLTYGADGFSITLPYSGSYTLLVSIDGLGDYTVEYWFE